MRKVFTTILATIVATQLFSQNLNWAFAKSFGGSDDEFCYGMCVDQQGNIFTCGLYCSLDLALDTFNLHNALPYGAFLAKHDNDGLVQWTKNIYGYSGAVRIASNVVVDLAGNVYVTGFFGGGDLNIDGQILHNQGGYSDFFIAKFSNSGSLLWAKMYGNWSYDYSNSLTIDKNNNLLITGLFYADTLVLDSIAIPNPNHGCFGDIFVAQINPAGTCQWAKRIGGFGEDKVCTIKTDAIGNIYLAGNTNTTTPLDIDGHLIFNTAYSGVFLIKLDSSGQFLWAQRAGNNYQAVATAIAIDNLGDVYFTGGYRQPTITFDTITLSNCNGWLDAFIAKYDSNGNIIWAKMAGGTQPDKGTGLCVDSGNDVYFYGESGSPIFTIGSDSIPLGKGLYIVKLNAAGGLIWAKTALAQNECASVHTTSILIDNSNNLFISGNYPSKLLLFDSIAVVNSDLNPASCKSDFYLAKLSAAPVNVENIENQAICNIFPNPASNNFHVTNLPSKSLLQVLDISGKVLLRKEIDNNEIVNTSQLTSGMYFVLIMNNGRQEVTKLIIEN